MVIAPCLERAPRHSGGPATAKLACPEDPDSLCDDSNSDGSESLDVQLDNKYHEAKSNIEDELDKPNADADKEALNEALTEFNEVSADTVQPPLLLVPVRCLFTAFVAGH